MYLLLLEPSAYSLKNTFGKSSPIIVYEKSDEEKLSLADVVTVIE